jgi:hypothetical protein
MSDPPSGDHLTNLRDGGENEQSEYALPSILPLSHSNPFLKSEKDFDVDAFLLSRATHTSLPELRSELRNYLADLKAELVQLLNDDYESFLSLSTDLRSEGPRLMRMKLPMGVIRADIQVSPATYKHPPNLAGMSRNRKIGFFPYKTLWKPSWLNERPSERKRSGQAIQVIQC